MHASTFSDQSTMQFVVDAEHWTWYDEFWCDERGVMSIGVKHLTCSERETG